MPRFLKVCDKSCKLDHVLNPIGLNVSGLSRSLLSRLLSSAEYMHRTQGSLQGEPICAVLAMATLTNDVAVCLTCSY